MKSADPSIDESTAGAEQRGRAPGSLTWVFFPVLLATIIALSLRLLASDLPRPAVSTLVLLGTVLSILILERIFPFHRAWNAAPERSDLLLIVGNRLVDIAVIGATLAVLASLKARDVFPSVWGVWPTQWPLLMQAVLGITLAESIRYAMHRRSHRPGWLARIHLTHHVPRRMYTLNGPRLHPLNQLWLAVANVVPMLALGADLSAVILALNITTFFVLFQHANLRMRFDGWNLLLATPDAHRVHHAREQQIGPGANYGIVLLVFDRLFGTWQRPSERGPSPDGIGA